jgi:hypothetical protein
LEDESQQVEQCNERQEQRCKKGGGFQLDTSCSEYISSSAVS